ncbi:hypothetical protein CQ018_08705 [Arthrobacter sp. MYb227]|uniref:hypothetical protein n=1 Tax=Arthrobacter sp. MYb227 TaxID=1848601 RepID=UPI000CFAE98B|nr:hypothetical protein [Arthrobacter sp. MYb227]PQZ93724.1 hypothetical protein CQ018_08705 [Arthrobacter sp. MYb227]
MRFDRILPDDEPNPRIEKAWLLKLMPIAVMGLAPQPSVEDTGDVGIQSKWDGRGYTEMSASVTYTLWRNPDDRSDPINLADPDEQRPSAIEDVPPHSPRPAWMLEQVERIRYPLLMEAVRTTWHPDPTERPTVGDLLVEHINDILRNYYRRERGLGRNQWGRRATGPTVTGRSVSGRGSVLVNGVDVPAVEIDTDPFVYGVGAELEGVVVTAVLPRTALKHILLHFVTRS